MNPSLPRNVTLPSEAIAIIALALAAAALWWLLSGDNVVEVARDEEVDMFDLVEDTPPELPQPELVEPDMQPEQTPQDSVEQAIQPDPLSPEQPTSSTPPAGDLNSLLQDPTGQAGAFSGGQRGQGGRGNGPMIGGTGRGGGPSASRAYAESVLLHVQRQLRRSGELRNKSYRFRIRLSVSPSGAITIRSTDRFDPPDLGSTIRGALRGLGSMSSAPPEGMPNAITLSVNSN